jgi:hypothetical protein
MWSNLCLVSTMGLLTHTLLYLTTLAIINTLKATINLEVWTGAENFAPTGIRSPDRPARSQSLYRLSYPAHSQVTRQA